MLMLILTFDTLISFITANRPMISLLSAIVAAIFALVFLLPIWKYNPIMVSRWGKAFGWAFFSLAARYSVMFISSFLSEEQASAFKLVLIKNILLAIFSGLSNFFFLKVAVYLLGENRILRHRPLFKLSLSSKALRVIVISIIVSVAFLAIGSNSWLARLPDSLISASSIFLAGYAIYVNINVRRDYFIAYTALFIAFLYALVQIIYGVNPLFAQWFPIGGEAAASFDNKLNAWDNLLFAIALPLKFGTFFPAYFLFMLIVSSVRDIQNLLKQIADGRREFLEHGGVVKAISSSLKADRVSLSIKLPGNTRNRIATFFYLHSPVEDNPHETQDSHRKPVINELNKLESEAAKEVLITGEPSISEQVSAFPVIFHGAVIGCLEARLNKNKFSETDISELEDMARFVSPAVYSYRELASIDQISYRIARLQFGREKLPAKKALENVITILQDALSPLAVEIHWDIGFNSDKVCDSLKNDSESPAKESEEICAGDGVLPIKNDLILTLRRDIEWDDEVNLTSNKIFFAYAGKITFCIPASQDHLVQPTLVTNFLHRRAISNVTVDGLLDLSRDYFNSVLQDFGVDLNKHRPANFQMLCQAINHTAEQAGLFWTAVTSDSGQESSYFSSPEAAEIVQQLQQKEQDAPRVLDDVTLFDLKPPTGETHHVMRIPLENTKQEMWFGIRRKGFGMELKFVSPWSVFLKQFAEIANAAMLRITASRDLQRLEIENIRQQGMAKSATNANILAHDLKNYSGGVHNTLSFINDSLIMNRITIEKNFAERITDSLNKALDSAKKITEITKIITLETKLDDHQPCSLTRAVKHVVGLLSGDFSLDNIKFEIEIKGDHNIDVPYYVATVAIKNLVSNARNAIVKHNGVSGQGQGRIFISVDENEEDGFIICYVKDNGPGIPEAFHERIWEYGYSTDPESGGWGLPLMRELLENNGSRIELLPNSDQGAAFKLSFPPSKTSEISGEKNLEDELRTG